MTGLDTHVLVRYLTDDDPSQAQRAAACIATAAARRERIFIGPIVLCEVSWVLQTAYGVNKADLLVLLERLLATSQFDIGSKDAVRRAVAAFRSGRADFADYLIGTLNQDAGCVRTLTFDRRLRADASFQLL